MKIGLACLALGCSFIFSTNCHAGDMRVREVRGKTAILEEGSTGMRMQVAEGQEIGNGWKVHRISGDIVTLEKMAEDGSLIRGQMPVPPSRLSALPAPNN